MEGWLARSGARYHRRGKISVVRASKHCRMALALSMLALAGSLWLGAQAAPPVVAPVAPAAVVPGYFVDITAHSGVHFLHQAPHTSRKYLLETMGSGVALFDCAGDGRLDLYLVNGAPFTDATPPGFIPQKTGPEYWSRMYHQRADGSFEDITEKSGLKGVGYGMGVAVADYDNDGHEDVFVTGYGGDRLLSTTGAFCLSDGE